MNLKIGAGPDLQHRSGASSAAPDREVAVGKQPLTSDFDGGRDLGPGKHALTGAGPVQRKAAVQAKGDLSGPDVGATAERGVAGASAPLPHLDAIQQGFGKHDLSSVRAQVGGPAAEASAALGAEAFATGDRVAFASAPDLHTAAHEAAHVVQQAGGVQLKDGVGQVGDRYEQHADAVADAVVAGRSAEGLLDGFAGSGAKSAATQRKAVQLLASDYKDDVAIKAMTLSAFDTYAHTQADWATSTTLGADKEKLRNLLGFARKSAGLVLGACGNFKVTDLLASTVGQGGGVDDSLTAYSRAASVGKNAGTIHVEVPATTVAQALDWGLAIRALEKGIGGAIIESVITQNGTRQTLKSLVDDGAVNDFVTYVKDVKPLLDATNGKEIVSYLEFRDKGGQGKYAGYKGSLPEIRNYHRFTVQQLDMLAQNRAAGPANKTKIPPLPVCVVLQSAFDHNGAFHQDPFMTTVIARGTHLTVFAEGKSSIGEFSTELAHFAHFGKDDKVDEVMIAGHGNAKLMELAGDKGVKTDSGGKQTYEPTAEELVTLDPRYGSDHVDPTTDLVKTIKSVLRDDPKSRVVLNACLTASNSVSVKTLDPDPDKAAAQIKTAITKDPSLATAMKAKLGTHKGEVRGANASFGKVGLLDSGGSIDIVSKPDPKLTSPKLEYAEDGIEPTGVLRATLESWADDRVKTIDALKRRITAKSGDTNWNQRVICSLMKLIVAEPTNAQLINELTTAAGTLSHLQIRAEANVAGLKSDVPDKHLEAIITDLTGTAVWKSSSFEFVPLVAYQVWIAKNNGKVGAFLSFLDGSSLDTLNSSAFFDLGQILPLVGQLLPLPGVPATPPRGSFLIALLYLVKQGTSAPQQSKDYIKAVVGGTQAFPGTCNVDNILKGAPQQRVLEAAGVIAKATAPTGGKAPPVAPTPNVAPTGVGNNTIAVDSVTQKCTTYGLSDTNAYMLPAGNKIGSIPPSTALNVIGTTKGTQKGKIYDSHDVDFLAVEYNLGGNKTVFVVASDVHMT